MDGQIPGGVCLGVLAYTMMRLIWYSSKGEADIEPSLLATFFLCDVVHAFWHVLLTWLCNTMSLLPTFYFITT